MTSPRGPGRARARAAGVCVLVATSALAGAALANGRYPDAQQVIVDPSNPERLWLRATYGVVTSADSGSTWSWICESAVGYSAGEDPMLAVLGDGAVLSAASTGLAVSRDHGCTWPRDPAVGERYARDVAAFPGTSRALALTVLVRPDGRFEAGVYRTDDGGASFQPLGGPIATDVVPSTIDPAPTDPSRLYVSGVLSPGASRDGGASTAGVLLRSSDGGSSWVRLPIPGIGADDEPLIAGVSPASPDVVYLRVHGATPPSGAASSWLVRSDDAGASFREVLRVEGDMKGFALSPDGGTVFVGVGNSRLPGRTVNDAVLGLYRASTLDHVFSRVQSGHVGCVTADGARLLVCSSNATLGFELGASTDGGDTIRPLLRFGGIGGPLACAMDAAPGTCADEWETACRSTRSCPAEPDAGRAVSPGPSRGCGCTLGGQGPAGARSSAAALAVVGLAVASRRALRRLGHSWTKSRST